MANTGTYSIYLENNTVRSLVVYDWRNNLNIFEWNEVFKEIIFLVGGVPDVATVFDGKIAKDYAYINFLRRKIIGSKKWTSLGYRWKRSENSLSDFSIDVDVSFDDFRCFEIHIDSAAIRDLDEVFGRIISLTVDRLSPIYGVGYDMPYYWGPKAFARGDSLLRYGSDNSIYGAPSYIRERALAFGPFFRRRHREFGFQIRDVFEINIISNDHLACKIGGMSLKDIIIESGFGRLKQVAPAVWIWGVPPDLIEEVRGILVNSDILIIER